MIIQVVLEMMNNNNNNKQNPAKAHAGYVYHFSGSS